MYMGVDNMHILKIINLCVKIEDRLILKDFNLEIKSGEIHAIMGPNGTGKSTLSKVIMGDPTYEVVSGQMFFDEVLLNDLTVDQRARLGIFLGMQMPIEVEGVTNADFLRTALHNRDGKDFKLFPFVKKLDKTVEQLKINKDMIHRSVNKGFSGGERKKNEILQMYMLEPKVVLLDEIDSGLDIDSLKLVGEQVMNYYNEHKPAILVITHYQRLLEYIKPDYVHILQDGSINETGDITLVNKIETTGYDGIKNKTKVNCELKEFLKNE
jgi:Fe-S cluster assembly ATP-binding protein